MRNRGFTLIELIVAITIIAVITALAVVNFGGTNKRARDSRRMADLEKVRIALEGYRQATGAYPADLPTLVSGNYLQSVPVDPRHGVAGYTYGYTRSSNYVYRLCARMEDSGYSLDPTCGGSYNYRVTNP